MREVEIRVWDDIELHQHGQKVEAETSVVIGLDGERRELDVTGANAEMVRKQLGELMAAGHEPEPPPRRKVTASANKGKNYPTFPKRPDGMLTMAQFARREGVNFITKGGNYSYPVELRRRYAEYLERGVPERKDGS